jgi:hypothetical protein
MIVLSALLACGGHRAITGRVLDRNGDPIERAIVSVHPGGVEIVTDENGRYVIDYLRTQAGERTEIRKKTDYELEAFLPGYHITRAPLSYRRGKVEAEPITLVPDTVRMSETDEDLDPSLYPDRSQSAGSTYEGE